MEVLVTGGAGYIGSHTVLSLLEKNYSVVVIDNLCNSSMVALDRVQDICNKKIKFYQGDVRDTNLLRTVFKENTIQCVIHFAGLKSVGESVAQPLNYYDNNLTGTITVLEVMSEFNVRKFIFSSSATVYGDPQEIPLKETSTVGGTTNPYGTSKFFAEKVLTDYAKSNSQVKITILRYFNPVGAHFSGLIGESPKGIPNNILPYITQVAVGKLAELNVFGNDYPTKDGTGVRDYIHVMDLAEGHIAALNGSENGINIYNLGTGEGYSVLEVLRAFERVTGKKVSYKFVKRRPGDIAECWSDPTEASKCLGWKATRSLDEMLADAWRWQIQNPSGFEQ
ncbi:UDP-glucose 4-epimerase GalE [Pantoea allii]|uniref:UDP-glucose 4-epimerase GalE n=1 Tax=Pantoea allii TaxID=574096 RepID=UPI0039775A1B